MTRRASDERSPGRRRRAIAAALAMLIGSSGCGDRDGGSGVRFETIAGGLTIGDHHPATATFIDPQSIAVDAAGNVFILDANTVAERGLIRRVDARTGTITTIAGGCDRAGDGDFPSEACRLRNVASIAASRSGDVFAGTLDDRLFRIDGASGALRQVAGREPPACSEPPSPALEACVGSLTALVPDASENLFIAARSRGQVLRLDASSQRITVAAGTTFGDDCREGAGGPDGALPATAACLAPEGVALDQVGSLFIADHCDRIRRVDAKTGAIATVAGVSGHCHDGRGDGGRADAACFANATDVAVDVAGDVFVADQDRIRHINSATGLITTALHSSRIEHVASAPDGSVVFTERLRVSRLDVASGRVTALAGNAAYSRCGDGGPARDACLGYPAGIAFGPDGSLYFADYDNDRVGRIDAANGLISTVAGGTRGFCGDGGPAIDACFRDVSDVVVDPAGNLFIADRGDNDQGGEGEIVGRVRRVDAQTGVISTVAGNCVERGSPVATEACVRLPRTLLFDASGQLLVGDQEGVRRIDLATNRISDVVGGSFLEPGCHDDDIPALESCLNASDLALDAAGNLYVLDLDTSRVHRIDAATGRIKTVAGNGTFGVCADEGAVATEACLFPYAITVADGGELLIATGGVLRAVDPTTGLIRTIIGTPADSRRCVSSAERADECFFPNDLERDPEGRLVFSTLRSIRRVTLPTP